MHIRGEPNGRALAAALTLLWRAGLGDIKKQSRKISSPELVELLDKNPSVRRSLSIAKSAAPAIPHGLGTAIHYLFQNESRGKADSFFFEFSDDLVQPSEAVFTLRRALDNILDEGGKRSPVLTVALAFKAWTAYKEGRDVKLIRFSIPNLICFFALFPYPMSKLPPFFIHPTLCSLASPSSVADDHRR